MTQNKSAKTKFCSAINKIKVLYWQELVNGMDGNPWGLGYKLAANARFCRSPVHLKLDIVRVLFQGLRNMDITSGAAQESTLSTDVWRLPTIISLVSICPNIRPWSVM